MKMSQIKHLSFAILVLFLAVSGNVSAQKVAIKTDALSDLMLLPNLNAELVTGNKTSVNLTIEGGYHGLYMKDFRAVAVMPEFRYWFHGRPMTREFIGFSVMGGTYQFTSGRKIWNESLMVNEKKDVCYDGDVFGFGLTFGYVWYLSPRWALEAHAGVGMYRYVQHRYTIEEAGKFAQESNSSYYAKGWACLPYKLGVTFAYIIK